MTTARITLSQAVTLVGDLPATLLSPVRAGAEPREHGVLEAGQTIRIERNHSLPPGLGESEIVVDDVGARHEVKRSELEAATGLRLIRSDPRVSCRSCLAWVGQWIRSGNPAAPQMGHAMYFTQTGYESACTATVF